ncbi:MAG TPA: hypothetical protein PLD20_31270 [Blastocatellia bacterium]|nr:hypothetical protein [Blastocatellia bacterium]HMY75464.1 hypothetical protein [Blastocatellia bacterium]HMZ22453.1 hypothetical protein [Blastocatellia bacterium]HNG32713.1 hypothetical protein [Blastocatellia bacterium]
MKQKFAIPVSLLCVLVLVELGTTTFAQRRVAYGNRLTGTYTLDVGRSDDAQRVANQATRDLNSQEADRVRNALLRRLDAPQRIALDQSGRRITIISSSAPQVTLTADNRGVTETRPNGRTVTTTSSLSGNVLTVNSNGDRGSDFNVTFDPSDDGRGLRVTKRIYTERLSQPVEVVSYYNRTANIAQWNIYDGDYRGQDSRDRNARYRNDRNNSRFAIPNGTVLTAVLNQDLTTRQAQEGDRFTMTVRSPRQYNGAVIEGVIRKSDRSGRITGRSELALDFQRVRMNGRDYDFAGLIENVRTTDGEDVRIDNEGAVREDDSQTTRTVTRSGIGAALGAIIGGIAGGGKGAAIGAAVGAGAGAGTVLIQGRDDLNLRSGTEFTIRASAPNESYSSR